MKVNDIINLIRENIDEYKIVDVDVNMGGPSRPTSLKGRYRIDPDDLVRAFGKPQSFKDKANDVDYLWDISIDYKNMGIEDEDENYVYLADVQLYTRKYDDGLPPLSEQYVWNLGATNQYDHKMVFEQLLREKGIKYKYV